MGFNNLSSFHTLWGLTLASTNPFVPHQDLLKTNLNRLLHPALGLCIFLGPGEILLNQQQWGHYNTQKHSDSRDKLNFLANFTVNKIEGTPRLKLTIIKLQTKYRLDEILSRRSIVATRCCPDDMSSRRSIVQTRYRPDDILSIRNVSRQKCCPDEMLTHKWRKSLPM